MQPLFDDRNQHVDRHSDPDLCLYAVLGRAEETLDSQVLFDPLEEEFDLPPRMVQGRHGGGGDHEVVGEQDEAFVQVGRIMADTPLALSTGREYRRRYWTLRLARITK
jgi:hypothetical protein